MIKPTRVICCRRIETVRWCFERSQWAYILQAKEDRQPAAERKPVRRCGRGRRWRLVKLGGQMDVCWSEEWRQLESSNELSTHLSADRQPNPNTSTSPSCAMHSHNHKNNRSSSSASHTFARCRQLVRFYWGQSGNDCRCNSNHVFVTLGASPSDVRLTRCIRVWGRKTEHRPDPIRRAHAKPRLKSS